MGKLEIPSSVPSAGRAINCWECRCDAGHLKCVAGTKLSDGDATVPCYRFSDKIEDTGSGRFPWDRATQLQVKEESRGANFKKCAYVVDNVYDVYKMDDLMKIGNLTLEEIQKMDIVMRSAYGVMRARTIVTVEKIASDGNIRIVAPKRHEVVPRIRFLVVNRTRTDKNEEAPKPKRKRVLKKKEAQNVALVNIYSAHKRVDVNMRDIYRR